MYFSHPGVSNIDMVYRCLSFEAFFAKLDKAIGGGGFIRNEGAQFKNWVYCEHIVVKAPNLGKNGCFSIENGILMGG